MCVGVCEGEGVRACMCAGEGVEWEYINENNGNMRVFIYYMG